MWDSNSLDLPGVLWEKIDPIEGTMPNLKGHAAIKITETLMYIFGGYDQKGEPTDTSVLFDIERRQVTHFETRGKPPGPRAFHVVLN